jgi:hypothetical protein
LSALLKCPEYGLELVNYHIDNVGYPITNGKKENRSRKSIAGWSLKFATDAALN